MKDHTDCEKGFYHVSKAYYSDILKNRDYDDEITIGYYHPDGGTTGEFNLRWENLGGEECCRLIAWDDSWHALSEMPELISFLADMDGECVSPDEICESLKEMGFTDLTPTKEESN